MNRLILITSLFTLFLSTAAIAQKKEKNPEVSDPDSTGIVEDRFLPTTAPLLFFDTSEKKEKKKKDKKKKKKNIYFGEKTKKGKIKFALREQTQYQFFHYTNQKKTKDPYIRDIHWYDTKDKVIRTKEFDSSRGFLLHGPYQKVAGETILEQGNFYFGTKHGIWLTFDGKNILQDKLHYSEGWPKDSRVSYYNRQEQQIEMLTPIEYELKEGNFYHFYEDGKIAVTGEFHYGEKVGLWTEYWNDKSKVIRKREIQYQEEPFSKSFKPYIRAEWDKEGNLVYRKDGISLR